MCYAYTRIMYAYMAEKNNQKEGVFQEAKNVFVFSGSPESGLLYLAVIIKITLARYFFLSSFDCHIFMFIAWRLEKKNDHLLEKLFKNVFSIIRWYLTVPLALAQFLPLCPSFYQSLLPLPNASLLITAVLKRKSKKRRYEIAVKLLNAIMRVYVTRSRRCLLYTSPSPRD